MAGRTKLDEVAELAKVSTATVSRVLNGGTVKELTRARVRRAIEQLKYHPNLAARELAGGRSQTIGVIVSNLENPFFFDIYHTLENDACARGYEVVMANTDYLAEHLAASIRVMIGRRVAGLAAIVSEMDQEILADLSAAKVPVVFFDVRTPRPRIYNIRVNYRSGMEKVVAYLNSMGHRRLGFLGHHDLLAPLGERLQAVLNAVARHPCLVVESALGDDTLDGGRRAMGSLLASGFVPTAVICANDIMAVGALRALQERGLRVPEDVSVVGFDNIKLSEFCFPALTTVHIPRGLIGHIIADHLMPQPDSPITVLPETMIEPELLVRDSTGPVAVHAPELAGAMAFQH